ncbi:hypothetical protein MNBD_ACTINO02-1190 [hydrothermal vent metagenome]|uniref:Uncharacterized protein n=1 Tax=hydrothermal vent metagenome TaxID=652676 RepID=A0A3B0SQR9_9ZZZZ
MIDIFLPSTDRGVLFQLALWTIVSGYAIYKTRTNQDYRVLAIGVSLVVYSLMGVRALH